MSSVPHCGNKPSTFGGLIQEIISCAHHTDAANQLSWVRKREGGREVLETKPEGDIFHWPELSHMLLIYLQGQLEYVVLLCSQEEEMEWMSIQPISAKFSIHLRAFLPPSSESVSQHFSPQDFQGQRSPPIIQL